MCHVVEYPQRWITFREAVALYPPQTQPRFTAIMNAISAQMILLKCQGDELWPEDVCLAAGIPQAWIDELVEQYESGFDIDQNTIYKDGRMINQFQGVSDLLLAYKLADYIGIDWQRETGHIVSRTGKVAALKEALDEL